MTVVLRARYYPGVQESDIDICVDVLRVRTIQGDSWSKFVKLSRFDLTNRNRAE